MARSRRTRGYPEIHAALEAVGRIAGEAELATAPADRLRLEEGAFEKQVDRVVAYRGRLAAHDPRERHGSRGIGDHEVVGSERDVRVIEAKQPLPRACEADVDVAFELRQIERVQRLPEFEHHVVGDVDHGTDRAQAALLEAPTHPERRRRFDVHAGARPAAVAPAGIGRLDADCERDRRWWAGTGSIAHRAQRCTGERRDVARDTEDAQAVATIGSELEREQTVVEIVIARGNRFRPARPWQLEQTRRIVAQAELPRGAQHAGRGHPLTLASLISMPPGSFAPGSAHGTLAFPPRHPVRRRPRCGASLAGDRPRIRAGGRRQDAARRDALPRPRRR